MFRTITIFLLSILMTGIPACGPSTAEVTPATAASTSTSAPASTSTSADLSTATSTAGPTLEEVTIYMPSYQMDPPDEYVFAAQSLASMLGEETGLTIKIIVPTRGFIAGQDEAITALQTGQTDIATMWWLSYLVAHEKSEAEIALSKVRFGSPYYVSQIITHNANDIAAIEDLAGQSLCWVDPHSTSGYVIPSLMLLAAGLNPNSNARFLNNHNDVAIDVYHRECAAGGTYVGVEQVVINDYPDFLDVIQQVAVSPPIPLDGFVFRPDFPAPERSRIINALYAIADTPQGAELLTTLFDGFEGFVEESHSLYNGLETLIGSAGYTPDQVWEAYYH